MTNLVKADNFARHGYNFELYRYLYFLCLTLLMSTSRARAHSTTTCWSGREIYLNVLWVFCANFVLVGSCVLVLCIEYMLY